MKTIHLKFGLAGIAATTLAIACSSDTNIGDVPPNGNSSSNGGSANSGSTSGATSTSSGVSSSGIGSSGIGSSGIGSSGSTSGGCASGKLDEKGNCVVFDSGLSSSGVTSSGSSSNSSGFSSSGSFDAGPQPCDPQKPPGCPNDAGPDVVLPPPMFEGKLQDSMGEPVGAATVYVDGKSVVTAADGKFSIANVKLPADVRITFKDANPRSGISAYVFPQIDRLNPTFTVFYDRPAIVSGPLFMSSARSDGDTQGTASFFINGLRLFSMVQPKPGESTDGTVAAALPKGGMVDVEVVTDRGTTIQRGSRFAYGKLKVNVVDLGAKGTAPQVIAEPIPDATDITTPAATITLPSGGLSSLIGLIQLPMGGTFTGGSEIIGQGSAVTVPLPSFALIEPNATIRAQMRFGNARLMDYFYNVKPGANLLPTHPVVQTQIVSPNGSFPGNQIVNETFQATLTGNSPGYVTFRILRADDSERDQVRVFSIDGRAKMTDMSTFGIPNPRTGEKLEASCFQYTYSVDDYLAGKSLSYENMRMVPTMGVPSSVRRSVCDPRPYIVQ
jgi:hypothetical protein